MCKPFVGCITLTDYLWNRTASSPSPTATPSPQFGFAVIDEMSTCQPAMVIFSYAGPSVPFNLAITNDEVPQSSAPPGPSSTSSQGDINTFTNVGVPRAVPTGAQGTGESYTSLTLTENLSPFSGSYLWPKVNITQGWYVLVASMASTGFRATSSHFFIRNSSDVSCLIVAPPTSTGAPSSSTTSSIIASQTNDPTIPGSSSGRVSPGAIAGSVIGGLAVVGACIAAYLFIRFSKKSTASSPSSHHEIGKGAWGGLGSTDSAHKPSKRSTRPKSYLGAGGGDARSRVRNARHHSQADSLGPMLATQSQTQLPPAGNGTRTGGTSDEDVNSLALSPWEEKFIADEGMMVDSVAPLPMHGHSTSVVPTRRSSLSSQSRPHRPSVSTDYSYTSSGTRRTSLDRSHGAYPPPELIPMTRSPSSPSTSPSHPAPAPAVQRSTSEAASKLPAGGISAQQNRRTPRKPVPSYDPRDASLSPFVSSADPPRSSVQNSQSSSAGHLGEVVDVFDDSASQHSARKRPAGLPELNHKSSFGPGDNRPVHYLIPDMPPPVRD
ncbi:hypothetical protein HGRIS_000209 [Hohenbuehelia grisea]|uniref:Transmembrane protein n=1 Tax=Hohenbuehelia grisea TaxID=104357 RepID=A0ABR3JQD5_9AGAR